MIEKKPKVITGLQRLIHEDLWSFNSARLGLLMNQASVDRSIRCGWEVAAERFPGQIAALLSPQHGLWSEQQANMIETPTSQLTQLGAPVFSLYSETRMPTAEMLDCFDVLVIDLVDVGTRVFTFAWTMMNCLIACAGANKQVVILDRPNPLGGRIVEGPTLSDGFQSFVGQASIPMRHALTMGELALLLNHEFAIGAELLVVTMTGWHRNMMFTDTKLPWVAPSPNMPSFDTAVVYPGQVLLEGTNLSEGRGTTLPFQFVGAPFVDAHDLHAALVELDLPGLTFRPVRFRPTFEKWQDASCGGIAIHVTDHAAVRSYETTVRILAAITLQNGHQFEWLPPPYEYETEKMPIDILSGNAQMRETLDASRNPLDPISLSQLWQVDADAWWARVQPFLLYE